MPKKIFGINGAAINTGTWSKNRVAQGNVKQYVPLNTSLEQFNMSNVVPDPIIPVDPPSIGPRGHTGPTGSAGINGINGISFTGPAGINGISYTGERGIPGQQGIQGNVGPPGPQGPDGPEGPEGPQGIQGNIGIQGPQGIQGNVGIQGPEGIQGNVGPQGPQGIQGNVGIQGPEGIQGNVGPQGPIGPSGIQGPQGTSGGLVYFLNYNNRSVTKSFSNTGDTFTYYLAEQTSNTDTTFTYTLPNSTGPLQVPFTGATDTTNGQFILGPDTVTNNFIPGGVWSMNVYASTTSNDFSNNYISWQLYYNTENTSGTYQAGTYYVTKLASSSKTYLTTKLINGYNINNTIPTTFLDSPSKQVFVKITVGANTPSSDDITIYFTKTYPTNIQTSIPLMGATGSSYFSFQTSSTNLYYNLGNLAVGTTSAAYPLDISGSINITGTYFVNGTNMFLDTPLLGNATATTQVSADNSTRVATTAYVQTSLSTYYTKTAVDSSINGVLGNIYTKTAIDSSINGVLGNIYTKTAIDSSINGVLGNIYTKTAIDSSINGVLGNIYTKTAIDSSINGVLGNIYTKTAIDSSINGVLGNIYTKTAIDSSINGVLGNIYTKTAIDSSINGVLGNIYTKTAIDSSINGVLGNIYTKTAIDSSINGVLGNIYTKTAIDSSINGVLGNIYTKTAIDSSINGVLGNIYTKTAIDSSINGVLGNIYTKTEIDSSINGVLGNIYTKTEIDSSINEVLGNIYTKTAIDSSINEVLGNIYTKTAIDGSINSLIGFYTTTLDMNGRFNYTDLSINQLRTDIASISETGSAQDPSINSLISYNGVQDISIGLLPTKSIIDNSLGFYYTKTAIDASFATITYVDERFSTLTGVAPSTLDTLAEIADALQGDASFGTAIYARVNSADASINTIRTDLADYALTSYVTSSLTSYYTKTAIDSSINGVLGNIYTKTEIDSSINGVLGNIYTKTAIDSSINGVLGNIYTKTVIDSSINGVLGNIYTKTAIDSSINGVLGNIYTKTAIDSSINGVLGNIYTKTAIDSSINGVLGNIYTKTAIDSSINGVLGNIYTKTAIDSSINGVLGNIYTKTAIDSSINGVLGNIYTKTAIDSSINGVLGNIYTKVAIDSSINGVLGNIYTKTEIDSSINGVLGNIYTKTAIDLSINGVIGNTASLLTDVSFAGNIQLGTTRTISVGINKTPATAYALDIGGDLDVNGNAYFGMGTNRVGINMITPAYEMDVSGTLNARNILLNGAAIGGSIPGYSANTFSFDTSFNGNVLIGSSSMLSSFLAINRVRAAPYSLDVSGVARLTETGPGTLASGTTGSLVLTHTTTGRSSITFTSPSAATDYGYIQYSDNNNPNISTETNGGLMVLGIESNDGSGNNTSDRISLYASNGTGNVGINTFTPEYNLDISGTLAYSNVTEKLINNLGTVGASLTASFGDGLIRYITAFSAASALTITNIPAIPNRSYVFTFIYVGAAATTSYFSSIAALTLTNGVTGIPIVKGPFTAPASTSCFVQQFYVFITNVTNMALNTVIQTLTTYA